MSDPNEFPDDAPSPGASSRPEAIRALPLRHPWRWVGAAILLVFAAMLVHTLVFSRSEQPNQTGSRFIWPVVHQYLFSPLIQKGALITLELTVISMIVGIALGVLLAVMRLSKSKLISGTAWAYVWFFRGTPVLIQIFFWYFISSLYPHVTLGIPFGASFAGVDMNKVLTAFWAGALALSLNEGAYMSEIVRAGIISVDEGQGEAAESIGMSRLQSLRLIVLPQAMRLIIPPTGNETISMLKTTSLVSVIGVGELTHVANDISAQNYRQIQLLMVVAFWYLAMTTVLSIGQYYLERHYAKGSIRELPATPIQQLRRRFGRLPSASTTGPRAGTQAFEPHPEGEDHR